MLKRIEVFHNKILQGNALEILKQLPDESVHCCCTSPPYWGQRNYGTQALVWDAEPNCKHDWGTEIIKCNRGNVGSTATVSNTKNERQKSKTSQGNCCQICGAWRGELGSEPTIEMYVSHIVQIFQEVKRVLRPDSTLWLNIGDSYASSPKNRSVEQAISMSTLQGGLANQATILKQQNKIVSGLKPKDLCGIPWHVAFALQADGWWLRIDNIWQKKTPMPVSIQGTGWYRHRIRNDKEELVDCPGCEKCEKNDGYILRWNAGRTTKAHEYIFLLSKSPKYYFDQEAIKAPCSENTHMRISQDLANQVGSFRAHGGKKTNGPMKAVVNTPKALAATKNVKNNKSFANSVCLPVLKRNKRSVWTIAAQGFSGAHFAVFPEAIAKICIRAGTSERGVCPKCGAPWVRIMKKGDPVNQSWAPGTRKAHELAKGRHGNTSVFNTDTICPNITTGWWPSCNCNAGDPISAIILDPFIGSGTSAIAALSLGRSYIGIELKPEYVEMARNRIKYGTVDEEKLEAEKQQLRLFEEGQDDDQKMA